jgi:hypothetical protein
VGVLDLFLAKVVVSFLVADAFGVGYTVELSVFVPGLAVILPF